MNLAGTFQRDMSAMKELVDFTERFASDNDLGENARFLLNLVLEELFTNTVRHNPGGAGSIDIEILLAGADLEILIRDPDCPRFDPNTDAPVVDPALPMEARAPGGLGVHLVKNMMDRIEYTHLDRVGTTRLFKRLE